MATDIPFDPSAPETGTAPAEGTQSAGAPAGFPPPPWGQGLPPPGAVFAPPGWAMPPFGGATSIPEATSAAAAPVADTAQTLGSVLPRLGLTASLAVDFVNAALAKGVRLLEGGVDAASPQGRPASGHPGHRGHHGHPGHCGCNEYDCCRHFGQSGGDCCDYHVGTCD
jgi:hypothetical protein